MVAVAGDGAVPVVGIVLAGAGAAVVAAAPGVGVSAGVAVAGTAVDGEAGDEIQGADGTETGGVVLEAGAASDWDVSLPPPQAARAREANSRTSVWRFK